MQRMLTLSFFFTLLFLFFCFLSPFLPLTNTMTPPTPIPRYHYLWSTSLISLNHRLHCYGLGLDRLLKLALTVSFSFYPPSFNRRQFIFHIYRLSLSIKFWRFLFFGYFIIIVTITMIFTWNINKLAADLVQQRSAFPVYDIYEYNILTVWDEFLLSVETIHPNITFSKAI